MPKILKTSTTVLKRGKYPPHGEIHAEVKGNIVRYIASGPFNTELNAAYEEVQKSILSAMASKGAWGDLTIFHHSAMESTSELEAYSKSLENYMMQGMVPVATAFVLGPDVEGAQIMGVRYAKIYADLGMPFMIFQQTDEAEAWLQAKIRMATS